jgi:DNA recombination protein RmuC
MEQRLQAAETARQTLETAQATLNETLSQERTQAADKLRLLTEAKEQMTLEFQRLASGVMEQHGENFKKQNKEQIDALLNPLREKLGEFQTGLQAAQKETAVERATLGEQIRQLLQQGDRMTTETTNLTRALKGKSQTQGAWGEMVLASILERSGLLKDQHYFLQESVANDEGRRLRPDAKVKLPGAPHLVIDAKVSLNAFEAHVNAENDEDRATHLEAHLRSLRTHIATLASKDYHAAAGSEVDYVIMFVPIEGALSVALTHDPELTALAIERGVTIATPTTLMIALRTIANVWRVDNRNQNAELIAAEAGRLYDKFVGFTDDMKSLGARLIQAQSTYDNAMNKLSNGQGNLMARAEHLKRRGAKTSKSLPLGNLTTDEVALLAAEDREAASLEERTAEDVVAG